MNEILMELKKKIEKKEAKERENIPPRQVLLEGAWNYLDHISLRRYISLDTENLLRHTRPKENWMFPVCTIMGEKIDIGAFATICEKANEVMRREYGSFDNLSKLLGTTNDYERQIKELVMWLAVFPERTDELFELMFQEDAEAAYFIVFTPSDASSEIRLGDELPLPSMINVLNACLYTELVWERYEELAIRILNISNDDEDAGEDEE